MKRSYSTTDLAKMWEVSESTIKRWADAGMLKCRKTVGGHRKFDLDHVLEFQSRSGLSAKDLNVQRDLEQAGEELDDLLAGGELAEVSERYREAALAGRECATSWILTRAYMLGVPPVEICEQIVRPALHQIGEMWRAGRAEVFEEHFATFATLQALADLNSMVERKPPSGHLAIVGCAEGEFHFVASAMVRHLLEVEGWKVISLGTHTPLFSFADAVNRLKPEMICISVTMIDNLERTCREYEKLQRAASKHHTRIVLGGAAMQDACVRARFRGASYATSLRDLIEVLEK